jgi:hypothetical protein
MDRIEIYICSRRLGLIKMDHQHMLSLKYKHGVSSLYSNVMSEII